MHSLPLLVLATCIGQANANSELIDGIRTVLPKNIADKVQLIQSQDFVNLKRAFVHMNDPIRFAKDLNGTSPVFREIMADIRKDLKMEKLKLQMRLKPETKLFFNKTLSFVNETLNKLREFYKTADNVVKEDLRVNFPKLMLTLENPQIQADLIQFCCDCCDGFDYGGYGGYGGFGGAYGGYGAGGFGGNGRMFGGGTILGSIFG